MPYLVSLLPVICFIFFLFYLDSFKLVKIKYPVISYFWGCLSAGIAYLINTYFMKNLQMDISDYSKYLAPLIEEFIKAFILFFLFKKNIIGFLIDGAIIGFTIGAGFSFVENLYYLVNMENAGFFTWIIRGFGTAIMHCGTTTVLTLTIVSISKSGNKIPVKSFILGWFFAFVIHSLYNQFLLSPLISTLIIIIIVPLSIATVFYEGEKKLREWMELEMFSEVNLLSMIKTGEFSNTKAGQYIISIKDRFSKEVIVDILNFIRLYLELSVKAKSILLLKEAGFEVEKEKELEEKLIELKYLEKSIGKTGFLAIVPILRIDRKSLWKINSL